MFKISVLLMNEHFHVDGTRPVSLNFVVFFRNDRLIVNVTS